MAAKNQQTEDADEPQIVSPPQPEASRYSLADFQAAASQFVATAPDGSERVADLPSIAGVFREAGNPPDMTEAEFRDGFLRWHGERQ
jgi:hypothetical protein